MRGWVVGIYPDLDTVLKVSELQAALTHNTIAGIQSAKAAALATHYFLYNFDIRNHLVGFIDSQVKGPWAEPWDKPNEIGVGSKGMEAVHAALQAIMMHDNLADILKQCISFGGDTDTVATIAMGVASCASDIKNNLPEHLKEGLEDGTWGKSYLLDLDSRIHGWMKR